MTRRDGLPGTVFQEQSGKPEEIVRKARQGSSSVFFPVLSWRAAVNVLEGFSKVAVGDKAALLCDGGDTVIGALQPHCGHLGPVFDEKADRRPVD